MWKFEETPELLGDTPADCLFDDPYRENWEEDYRLHLAIHPNSPTPRR
jgi:hypothetical protein